MTLRSVSNLRGFTIRATDGAIGAVDDFLFDDARWAIRYLVANTGGWLTGRLVLISPISFRSVAWEDSTFHVALTRQQVEDSPSIAADRPVSRQMEEQYTRYYGYPAYWGGPGLWGAGMYPYPVMMASAQPPITPAAARPDAAVERQADTQPEGDPHLRSAREVSGYTIQARDGDLGHVEDFIADDERWAIRYMVVDTRNWWPGKHVLVAPPWIAGVDWAQSRVLVDLPRETIKRAPEYDPSALIDRAYEERLHRSLQRPPYWQGEETRRS